MLIAIDETLYSMLSGRQQSQSVSSVVVSALRHTRFCSLSVTADACQCPLTNHAALLLHDVA